MTEHNPTRRFFFAALPAMILLGIFILFNYYRSYQDTHQTNNPYALLQREHMPEVSEGLGKILSSYDFESGNANNNLSHLAFSGHTEKQSLKMSAQVQFSPGLWIKFKDLPGDSAWIRATGYAWFSCRVSEAKCSLVATCNHNGINYKYMSVPIENEAVKPYQWNKISIDYHIPPAPDREDVLQVYFWYRGQGEMLVDDIEIKLFVHDKPK